MRFNTFTNSILLESGLSRIYSKTKNYTCGIITAFRGDSTYDENKSKNRELIAYLLENEYSITKLKGSFIEGYGTENAREVGEEVLFVCNDKVEGDDGGELKEDLLKLGELYNQDSVLYIPFSEGEDVEAFLLGTSNNPDAFVPYHEKMSVGFPRYGRDDDVGEFFSRVRGRTIEFKESVKIEKPKTRNGKWAVKLLHDKVSKRL